MDSIATPNHMTKWWVHKYCMTKEGDLKFEKQTWRALKYYLKRTFLFNMALTFLTLIPFSIYRIATLTRGIREFLCYKNSPPPVQKKTNKKKNQRNEIKEIINYNQQRRKDDFQKNKSITEKILL